MAPRRETPSTSAKHANAQDRSAEDKLDVVLGQLSALREDVLALREEVRAAGLRRAPKREPVSRDPGDAVPPGLAVQEPAPLSGSERKARRSLERLSRD